MKILHITPQAPSFSSGGELAVYQSIISFKMNNYHVDYIGPEIKDVNIVSLYNHTYFLEKTTNKLLLVKNLLSGITNRSYEAFKKLDIDFDDYDYIYLEFTKLDYVLKKVKHDKLIVHVHNVEYDYANKVLKNKFSLYNLLIFLLSKKQEGKLLRQCHKAVVLTNNDLNRLKELYHIEDKFEVAPICVLGHD